MSSYLQRKSLGTADGKTTNMNHSHRIRYGSNNWVESAMRQYLNSDKAAGSVWTPQTKFDRPPSWNANTAGFMNGLDADFLAVIGKTTKVTCRNTVTLLFTYCENVVVASTTPVRVRPMAQIEAVSPRGIFSRMKLMMVNTRNSNVIVV